MILSSFDEQLTGITIKKYSMRETRINLATYDDL
jgi:hypothetical protein